MLCADTFLTTKTQLPVKGGIFLIKFMMQTAADRYFHRVRAVHIGTSSNNLWQFKLSCADIMRVVGAIKDFYFISLFTR